LSIKPILPGKEGKQIQLYNWERDFIKSH